MAIQIEWHKVESSNIDAIGIGENDEGGNLHVRFNSGSEYVYHDVPVGVIQGFLDAESKGKFFVASIKDVYPYEKV